MIGCLTVIFAIASLILLQLAFGGLPYLHYFHSLPFWLQDILGGLANLLDILGILDILGGLLGILVILFLKLSDILIN